MALNELVISRAISKTTATLNYAITGTSSDTTALAELYSGTPSLYNFLPRSDYAVEPVGDPTISETWLGTVTYSASSGTSGEVGDSVFGFDTTGGSQHITQSLGTTDSKAVSGSPESYAGAIGVSRNGVNIEVQGVDIVVPTYSFTETHIFAASTVTTAFKSTIFKTTGKVNSDSFKGTGPGECLFLGASGTMRNEDEWEITYNFAAQPNQPSLSVGSMTVSKNGWQYLWVQYEEKIDTGKFVKQPSSCYVEKVYETTAFSALGL